MEEQTGELTFPWGLSPLIAYLRTQTMHPKAHFVVLSILSHKTENNDQNIEIITHNLKLSQQKAISSTRRRGLRLFLLFMANFGKLGLCDW